MKKRILSIVLTAVLLIPSTVFAKGQKAAENQNQAKQQIESTTTSEASTASEAAAEKSSNSKKAEVQTNIAQNKQNIIGQQKKAENISAKNEFKAQIRAKHEIMKANTKKINELKKQINLKKEELAAILADIDAGKKTLSSDQLALLSQKASLVKDAADALKTSPQINSDVDSVQENVKGNKFEAALASLDKVIAKQDTRYAKLVDLNSKLDDLLAIARQAVPVSTSTSDNSSGTEASNSASTDTNTSDTSSSTTSAVSTN